MLFLSEAVSEETGLSRAGWFRSVFGLQNTPHLVRDLQSGPESGPAARFHGHQTNFYIIITII